MNTILLLIILIPIIEIYLFIEIGGQIGAFNTISLIFITAFVGVLYARYEGFNTLKSGMTQLVRNELPVYEIISGAALAFAALLLIIPGFATDFLGLLMITPITILSAPFGVRFAHSLSKDKLNLIFGFFILLMAIRFFMEWLNLTS